MLWLLAISPIWFGLAGHPVYETSEARYAHVSSDMTKLNHWLVPHMYGKPHLTKPPLTYWMQAVGIRWLGHTPLAVRLPSAVAGSLTLLLVLGFTWRVAGFSAGAAAMACLSLMPLSIQINRLGLTDAMLSFFWFATLACGYGAVMSSTRRVGWGWAGLAWLAVGLGLMVKGPLALLPIGLLVLWLLLAQQSARIRLLHIPTGMILSLVPLAIWVALICHHYPQALEIWRHEMLDRVTGSGSHPRPWWFYGPIFLGGLIPATLCLHLPGMNYAWREAWQHLRRLELTGLLSLSVALPFLMFSMMSGKLPSYLAPLAPSMAMLTGILVIRWTRQVGQPRKFLAFPNTLVGLGVALFPIGVAAGLLMPGGVGWGLALAGGITGLFSIGLYRCWDRCPEHRTRALMRCYVGLIVCFLAINRIENAVAMPNGESVLVDQIKAKVHADTLRLATFGFRGLAIQFYNEDLIHYEDVAQLEAFWDSPQSRKRILIADLHDWDNWLAANPQRKNQFDVIMRWEKWGGRRKRIIVRRKTTFSGSSP